MKCLNCGSELIKKKLKLSDDYFEGFDKGPELDGYVCENCKSTWFDEEQFNELWKENYKLLNRQNDN